MPYLMIAMGIPGALAALVLVGSLVYFLIVFYSPARNARDLLPWGYGCLYSHGDE